MMSPITPIKPKSLSDQVFDQLRELIFRGEFKPGEKILPERELAEALNVSRPTLRNAIHKLTVMGLLEQRQGQGTFVTVPEFKSKNPLAIAMETQDASLEDLLEVRMGLECNAASLAAKRADESDIRFLEKSIIEMNREVRSGRLGFEADTSFHMAISYATKNPLQIYIMKNFFDFLFVGIRENLACLYTKPGNIDLILDQHQAICVSIKKHDQEQSYIAMKQHIKFVQDFFYSYKIDGPR